MPPDLLSEGRATHHGDARSRQTTERERPHGDSTTADTSNGSRRISFQDSESAVAIDLTHDTDDNLRKHSPSQEPPSNYTSKRPKLSHEGDTAKAATGENLRTAEPSCLHLCSEANNKNEDDGLAKKDGGIEIERQNYATAQRELETDNLSLSDIQKRAQSQGHPLNVDRELLASTQQEPRRKQREFEAQNERPEAQLAQKSEEPQGETEELETEVQKRASIRRQEVSTLEKLDAAQQEVKALKQALERSEELRNRLEVAFTSAKKEVNDSQELLQEATKLRDAALLVNEQWGLKSKAWKDKTKELKKSLAEAKKNLKSTPTG